MKLYLSDRLNPYENIAFEKHLLDLKEEALFLWVNQPSVIIGRNQNPSAEVDMEYLKENKICLVRRYSGGGAVYHDQGNLNYSYISTEESTEEIINLIQKVLETKGIIVEKNGRNDLTVDGKKISGMAYLIENEWVLHHGTCLVDLNEAVLCKVLKPSKIKLQSKGITSVKSRVLNLNQKNRELSSSNLIASFCQVLNQEPILPDWTDDIIDQAKYLSSEEWIFAQSPDFTAQIEEKTVSGLFQVFIETKDNKIKAIKVYTDSLNPRFSDENFNTFIGNDYNPENNDKIVELIRLL